MRCQGANLGVFDFQELCRNIVDVYRLQWHNT
jgi:hypothetical protein